MDSLPRIRLQSQSRSGFLVPLVSFIMLIGAGSLALGADGGLDPLAGSGPVAPALKAELIASVPVLATVPVDFEAARREDEARDQEGLAPRFAIFEPVQVTPATHGVWESLNDNFDLWRLRISSAGVLSLNLGFTGYRLPKGAQLAIYPADYAGGEDSRGVRVFTAADNELHGELWTPVVLADDITVELLMPTESLQDYTLELTAVNKGYRFFGESAADKQGTCNIDVVCPEGDPWWDEINSVGVISTGGSTFCTGFMVNNTAADQTPYFMTANHCGISSTQAPSLVVYWNFQSVACGDLSGGVLSDFQTGSTWLATSSTSDFTLVVLDDPPNPQHNVSFAGWNRGSEDFAEAIAIHHPSTDEKAISFEDDPTTTTSYLYNTVPGDGSHIRVIDWDLGTTEPGSSGSPLFDPNHRVVGQLHGGYAACGNDDSDWYGRFSVSWGLGLATHLDPLGTGQVTLNTLAPGSSGLAVVPANGLEGSGDYGGPFLPASQEYTLENKGIDPLNYSVSADVEWVSIIGGTGALAGGATTVVTVSFNSVADGLQIGSYEGTISFANLTDGVGNQTRPLRLDVGAPELVYSFSLDSDPGWTGEDEWAFGVPLGLGGAYGFPDPTSGHTGVNVLGYNLSGDYSKNLPETHLVTTAIDCSSLSRTSVKFWRWLNVEQPANDQATISASSDGVNWTIVWSNSSVVEDDSWRQVEVDIRDVADGQATVYLRCTMGPTDRNWQYSGWNIDDVEIWGLSPTSATPQASSYVLQLRNYPNPFNPMTKIEFTLEQAGPVRVSVFDVQGRFIRRLVERSLPAGTHDVVWDGMDQGGRKVSSGVYFARLEALAQVKEHKMVLLK